MFQFLRRVSGSFLPRPDRPWSDDATSHAPTIGRKRRHSVTEQDAPSTAKRTKSDSDTECDSREDAVPPVDRQDVKEVTKDVKEVDLRDEDRPEDGSSIRPEVVPLPDSPSASPEPESESQDTASAESDEVGEDNDQEHADERDSVASSSPRDDAAEEDEVEPATTNTDILPDIAPAHVAVELGLHDTPETLEVKA